MNKPNRKIVISFIIFLILAMASMNAAALAYTEFDYIQTLEEQIRRLTATPTPTPRAPAKLKRSTDETISMRGGESKDSIIRVKNIGDIAAEKVSVSATTGGADVPLVIDLINSSQPITSIGGGRETELTLRVRVDDNAKAGTYSVNLGFSYRDSSNALVNDTDTVYIRVTGGASEPSVVMQGFATDPLSIGADSLFTMTATLQNIGSAVASDIQLVVEGLKSEEIFMSGASNNAYFNSLSPSASEKISFALHTAKDIKSGSYPLTFRLKYKNEAGDTKENTYPYLINVLSSEDSSDADRAILEIPNMPSRSETYQVGEMFNVVFGLKNTGVATAKNVKITATADSTGAIVPKSANIRTVSSIQPGASSECSFSFSPTAAAKSQNYVIGFKVEYETGVKVDGVPETASFEQYFGVNVDNPDAEDGSGEDKAKFSKPKIIIDSYVVEPIIVKAGQQFDLTMVFRNTHSTKSIENIKAVLTPNETTENMGSVFMPVNGSNTFYIDKIAPGQTSQQNFRMYAIPAADPRTYTITVSFKYQDEEYNEYDEAETIGIPVKQTTKLDTGNVMLPSEGFMGSPINIMFNLMNTGKATLSNLSVTIEGEGFDTSKSFMYFGSLNKSASGYYDAEITPTAGGQQQGVILISYEDEAGEVTVVEREFTVNVMEDMPMPEFPMEMGPGGEMPGMESSGGSLTDKAIEYAKKPLVWVGVAGVCVAAFFGKKFYDKKRRVNFDE